MESPISAFTCVNLPAYVFVTALPIPVNVGSCLHDNVAQAGFTTGGEADYQSFAGIAARNLRSITPWVEWKKRTRTSMYVCSVTLTLLCTLYCVEAPLLGRLLKDGVAEAFRSGRAFVPGSSVKDGVHP